MTLEHRTHHQPPDEGDRVFLSRSCRIVQVRGYYPPHRIRTPLDRGRRTYRIGLPPFSLIALSLSTCVSMRGTAGDGPGRAIPHSFLAKPVHRGPTAREAPLRLFARISEFYYRQALGADPGYNGVLTHNPMRSAHRHGEFLTHWGCNRPYSLSELAEPIPRGWRLPVKPTTEAGRNCALFVALMKWAGSPANIGREVLAVARATNDGLDVPLGDSEVAGLAKSVERYRRSWIAKGRFYTEAEREAWGCALGLR